MKRKPKNNPNIYISFPLFSWKRCINCGFEYHREKLFRKLMGPFHNGFGTWKYICTNCADDKSKAERLFTKSKLKKPPKITK